MSLSLVGKMKGLLFVSVPAYDSGLEALNFYQVQFYPFFFPFLLLDLRTFCLTQILQRFSP